jgi:hypothetical protein
MNGKKTIVTIIITVVVLAVLGKLVHDNAQSQLTLYSLRFYAEDKNSGDRLNVSISHEGGINYPAIAEIPVKGPYQITCVGTSPPKYEIKCEGYKTQQLALKAFKGSMTMGCDINIDVLKMEKIAEHVASPDS